MDVDLDRYREPSRDPAAVADRRAALLDQLGWLADEAAALAPVLGRLPAWALEGAPLPGDRSVKETLAHLARLDREGYPRWLGALEAGEALAAPEVPRAPRANERDVDALIEDLRRARADLIARVEVIPEPAWAREGALEGEPVRLDDLLLRIVRHDADALRALAYRLHEAKLTDRPQDLPK
ncbi:MAG: hypothetical protein R3181_07235 [Rubricoccaceae bacterium]|nr:hypothetical protein [Rubricoccaceae bacterium]